MFDFEEYELDSLNAYADSVEADDNGELVQVQDERGFWGDVGSSALRGASALAGTAGEVGEVFGFENEWQESHEKRMRENPWMAPDVSEFTGEESFLKRTFTGAVESLAPSVVPMMTGAAMGGAVAGPPGAIVGGLVSLFGFTSLGEGRKKYEEFLEKNPGKTEEAFRFGTYHALVQGGFETAAMVVDVFLPGVGKGISTVGKSTIRQLITRGPKEFAKDMGKIALVVQASEQTTELGQLEIGNALDQAFNMTDKNVSSQERWETVGTTFWMSLLFGLGSASYDTQTKSQIKRDIESGDPLRKEQALLRIEEALEKESPQRAKEWRAYNQFMEGKGLEISLDADIAQEGAKASTATEPGTKPADSPKDALVWEDNIADEILEDNKIPLGTPLQDSSVTEELWTVAKTKRNEEAFDKQARKDEAQAAQRQEGRDKAKKSLEESRAQEPTAPGQAVPKVDPRKAEKDRLAQGPPTPPVGGTTAPEMVEPALETQAELTSQRAQEQKVREEQRGKGPLTTTPGRTVPGVDPLRAEKDRLAQGPPKPPIADQAAPEMVEPLVDPKVAEAEETQRRASDRKAREEAREKKVKTSKRAGVPKVDPQGAAKDAAAKVETKAPEVKVEPKAPEVKEPTAHKAEETPAPEVKEPTTTEKVKAKAPKVEPKTKEPKLTVTEKVKATAVEKAKKTEEKARTGLQKALDSQDDTKIDKAMKALTEATTAREKLEGVKETKASGLTAKDVKEAQETLSTSALGEQTKGVAEDVASGAPTPEETAEAKDTLEKAGVTKDKALGQKASQEVTDQEEAKAIEEASSPEAKAAMSGDTKAIGKAVESRRIKGQYRQDAGLKMQDELILANPGQKDLIVRGMAGYLESVKTEEGRRTIGGVTWDGVKGVGADGTQFFLQKGRNKYQNILWKGEEEVGTYKTEDLAKEAAGTIEPLADINVTKVGKSNYSVTVDGTKINPVSMRTKSGAQRLGMEYSQNPEMKLRIRAQELNRLNAGEIKELGVSQSMEEQDYSYGDLEGVPEMDTPLKDRFEGEGKLDYHREEPFEEESTGYFKKLLGLVGIKSPRILVVDIEKGAETTVYRGQPLNPGITAKGLSRAQAAVGYDKGSNTVVLFINKSAFAAMNVAEKAETIAHEAGHVFERVFFHNAPDETQMAIHEEYESFVEDKMLAMGSGLSKFELRAMTRARMTAEGYAIRMEEASDAPAINLNSEESVKYYRYITSFEEWFADNTSKWATSEEKPVTLAEKFFSQIAKVFKRLFDTIKGTSISRATPEFSQFMDSLVERSAQKNQGYTPESGSIDELVRLKNNSELNQWKNEVLGITGMLDEAQRRKLESELRAEEQLERQLEEFDERDLEYPWEIDQSRAETEQEKALLAAKTKTVAYTTEGAMEYFSKTSTRSAQIAKGYKNTKDKLSELFKKSFVSSIDRLGKLSPELARKATKYTLGINLRNAEDKKQLTKFAQAYNRLPKDERKMFTMLAYSGNEKKLQELIKGKDGLEGGLKDVKEFLETHRKRAEAVGIVLDRNIDNYYPRKLNDMTGLSRFLEGDKSSGVWDSINVATTQAKRLAEEAGITWTAAHEEEIITSYLSSGSYAGTLSIPGALKARKIEALTPPMMDFYGDFLEGLFHHSQSMNDHVGAYELIGTKLRKGAMSRLNKLEIDLKKTPSDKAKLKEAIKLRDSLSRLDDNSILQDSMARFINQEMKSGKFDGQKAVEAMDIIRSRILEQGMHGALNDIRNVGLMSTLGDFSSVITQASEVVLNIYRNGPVNTLGGLYRMGKNSKLIDATILDLNQQLLDFDKGGTGTSKAVGWLLNKNQFARVDIAMKESFMTSVLIRAKRMNSKTLRANFGEYFKDDFKGLEAEVKKLDINQGPLDPKEFPKLIELAWSEQMKFQPLDVIANPQAYMDGGNLRVLYMLKTFQIRMMNSIYRESVGQMVKGDPKSIVKGFSKLAMMGTLLTLAGATRDELRDLYLGRSIPFRDNFWDNLLNIFMLSKYDTDKFKSEGVASQIIGKAMPPLGFIDYPLQDFSKWVQGEPSAKFLKTVPFFGKLFYDRMTSQRDTNKKEAFYQRIRDNIGQGEFGISDIRGEIRDYNEGLPQDDDRKITTSMVSRLVSKEKKKYFEEEEEEESLIGVNSVVDSHVSRLGLGSVKGAKENLELFAKIVGWAENKGQTTGQAPGTSAKGLYQFTDASLVTALNRLKRTVPEQAWMKLAYKHKDASKLTKSQQDLLFWANMFDRDGTDDRLKEIIETGSVEAMTDLYYNEHHTDEDTPGTKENWENAIAKYASY